MATIARKPMVSGLVQQTRRAFGRVAADGSRAKASIAATPGPDSSRAKASMAVTPTEAPPSFNFKRQPSVLAEISHTLGAPGFPDVNARYKPDPHTGAERHVEVSPPAGASAQHWREEDWSAADLQGAVEDHVMLTWTHSAPAKDLPKIARSEGVYVYDGEGNKYLDWTSQAVCCNLGHTVPKQIMKAVEKQMTECVYMYSGMGMVPVRAKLSKLMAELMPGDITGFLFPCGGSEANEAAIRIARRFTGRQKILTQYRSYHGGTAEALGSTGDFRRSFVEANVNGFVKMFNPQPWGFTWGQTDEEATTLALKVMEEQILSERPNTIAAVMLESIVGAGGVLVPPVGYVEGVRALCDKYDILLILDEVMAGFGRTGEMWAFQHFDNVVPDIVTSAKGLSGAYLPLSMVGVREKIRQHFLKEPLGWGATYHAHPVALAAAYESVKYTVEQKLPQRAKQLQPVMMDEMQKLVNRHPSVKTGRCVGLFGCIDLVGSDGRAVQQLGVPSPEHVNKLRAALKQNGIMALFRPPLMHCCPPLVITEEELRDGFSRVSEALLTLDAGIAAAP
jgi:adenosylmethionine-8-amino-7-oxononanoate aminotransferase